MDNLLLSLILFINYYAMDYIEFENSLRKPISDFREVIGNDFEDKYFGKDFYYIPDESIKKNYYGTQYSSISVLVDEDDKLRSITIHFREVISRKSYDLFVEDYGLPINILIVENRQIISEGTYTSDNFTQHLVERSFELREGEFEENPLYIIWKKEHFQIKAFLRHKQNISEITFSIPADD